MANSFRPITPRRLPWVLAALVAGWALAVLSGFAWLQDYASTPGRGADAPAVWPADVALARSPGRHTLALLAHPRCPCTRASLAELARLMPRLEAPVDAYVLFVEPAGTDWAHGDLWDLARAIPGVVAVDDRGGTVADALGVHTSGQVVVYDPAGRLQFAGGITPARGHEGDSGGADAIAILVRPRARPTAPPAASTSLVFGCDLHDPERAR
jgi:hypothetical protein